MLRISVTDRCNFRCLYCMPAEGVKWLPREDILSFEEIEQVVRSAVEHHDIRRFKLTGGEPTVRHDIVGLVSRLRRISGVDDLSMTTNGMLLAELARPLREAGLGRITISLDSLRSDRFQRITRTGNLQSVLRGLDAVEEIGFSGTKINCVTMRGVNDDEAVDFAKLSLSRVLTVRFIEYMPLGDAELLRIPADRIVAPEERGPAGGCGAQDRGDAFVSEQEIRARIESALGPLVPVDRATEPGVGPANVYKVRGDVRGRIGFISAMSHPFCAQCNRLRLTASGVLRSCLFEGGEVDVRCILRGAGTRVERNKRVAEAMERCVQLKPDVHSGRGGEQMSRIGG